MEATDIGPTDAETALTWVSVALRIAAAAALVVGPWTDEAAELAGWDIERFMIIAGDAGRAWRDNAVEYPPASVAVFEILDRLSGGGSAGLVMAHRILVAVTLAIDLAVAWLLGRRDRRMRLAYLLLGLPLVPMGLLRLDLLAVLAAVAASLVVIDPLMSTEDGDHGRSTAAGPAVVLAGAFVALGVMIKLWPVLLIPALWATRRERAAAAAVAGCALCTVGWLLWADSGLDPIRQIVDLRGATGWQLESVGGVATALGDALGITPLDQGEGVRLELNAFRIGTVVPWLVTLGRALAVAAIVALAWRARRNPWPTTPWPMTLPAFGAVMLGGVAALVVSSPLLSPQFLLWLTPWAALLASEGGDGHRIPTPVILTAGATVTTGAALAFFGPSELAHPVAAVVLAGRNALLIALPFSCWRWLDRSFPASGA